MIEPYPDPIPNHLIPEMSDRVCELVGNDLDAMGQIVMALRDGYCWIVRDVCGGHYNEFVHRKELQ
jgi:hypothetical protein